MKETKTWILGFGSLAKVVEPAALVKDVKEQPEKCRSGCRQNCETSDASLQSSALIFMRRLSAV
jgi:hypothetical protein